MSLLWEAVDYLGAELNWQIQATGADIEDLSLVPGFCFTFIPSVPPFKSLCLVPLLPQTPHGFVSMRQVNLSPLNSFLSAILSHLRSVQVTTPILGC